MSSQAQQLSTSTQQQQQPSTQSQQPATTTTTAAIETTRNSSTRNNRHRNNNRNRNPHPQQATSFNNISQPQQQSINPNQHSRSDQQQRRQHQQKSRNPSAQDQFHRPNPNYNRQPPPHLTHAPQQAGSTSTLTPTPVGNNHDHSNQSSSARPNRNQRKKTFGSTLTDQARQRGAANQDSKASTPITPVDLSSLSLSARLIVELSSSTYDCSICISPIAPHHPIYNCPNCYAVFHLNCSNKWASRSVADTSAKAILLRDRDRIPCSEEALKGEWRCPGCQDRQIGQDSIPNKYTCWCGKVEQLNSRNKNHQAGRSKIPHSCGKRCGKISAEGCTHGCMEECHPGSCAPCPAVIKTKCYCQKTELSIRCSQLYSNRTQLEQVNSELLSCGEVCNHDLSCGLHPCKQVCHPEDCEECTVIRQKSCYCGHVLLDDQKCSDKVDQHPFPQSKPEKLTCVSEDGSEWLGEFACKDPCERKYDCGIHSCELTCHPHLVSTPLTCPFSAESVKTCPCGTTSLDDRQTCSDPIPTCHNPCGKLIASCGHVCPKICHLGPCGPCKSLVTTLCNCGKDKIVRQCIELEQLIESAILENELRIHSERKDMETVKTEAIEYRCERPCRVLRHCGKHTCHRRCCPLSFLENILHTGSKHKKSQAAARQHEDEDPLGLHVCDLKCNKKLSCGLHSCQLQDHRGPCPTCLQASFDEWFCHCGATVIQPPVPCGTKIDCHGPCQRPPPSCGHPKPPHTCHEEPDCPPCPYLTEKPCQCDKKKPVKNVRCSQPKVSCGSTCDNLLSCGAHRCSRQCHPSGQCEACDRECLKPRKHCGHGCQQKCHAPSSCRTEDPCEATIDIQCGCGRITQKIKCASCDGRPEGNQERALKCNDDCILFQRNMAVANALQITQPPSTENQSSLTIEWSSRLLNFFGTHALFAKAIEKQLAEFLKSDLSIKLSSSKNSLIISTFSKLKQAFLLELVPYYRIKPETVGEEPRFTVKLVKDCNSCLPTTLLSEAHKTQLDPNKSHANQDKGSSLPVLGTTLLRIPSGSSTGISPPKNEHNHSSGKGPSTLSGADDPSMICGANQIFSILFNGVFGYDRQSLTELIGSAMNYSKNDNQVKFLLTWIKDEDVLLRLSASSSPGSQTDFDHLVLIYKSVVSDFYCSDSDVENGRTCVRKQFCKSMTFVKVELVDEVRLSGGTDGEGFKIKNMEPIEISMESKHEDHHHHLHKQGWKSSTTSTSNNKKLHSKLFDPSQHSTSNRFSSLLSSSSNAPPNRNPGFHPHSSSSTFGNSSFGDVISGGFNRPPIAVLAPMASTSTSSNGGRNRSDSKLKVQEEEDVVDDWETEV
ncbi:hypothetical protein KEM48_012842 [Puccinia striiformis f. sp. tritici PST-130]|nr:hypothetical protein Pst134EB_021624 [Puccinia striiformis f. sp. tritici]KAI9629549.1 hypothetical protein KEM48_012842 [Puccinia striiformis f. sp. tritici PST-130]